MKLRNLYLKGFKSFDSLTGQTIQFGDVTVLLGGNGSGKSNLVSFFSMLNYITTEAFQRYVGRQGTNRLLFYGSKQTESIEFKLSFYSEEVENTYEVKLLYGLPDRLFVGDEKITCLKKGKSVPHSYSWESGGSEVQIRQDNRATSKILYKLLSGIRTYQFHDTTDSAKIKNLGYVDDTRYLRSDGGNLAAFLKMLKETDEYRKYYDRIVRHIQRVMPQFGDFILSASPNNRDYVRLNWTDNSGNDYLFDPNQISDGSLRFMALVTLLLQPPDFLPNFIVLDEPELGLHPVAVIELARIILSVSRKTQILLATQSTRLVDEFSLEDVVIVGRDKEMQSSIFKKLDEKDFSEWMKQYSLSELWEKNILGGQP